MKKLLFLIHTLGGGGAEKALVNLVNHLDANKYDITVETLFDDGVNAKSLNPNIHYISRKAPSPKGISVIMKCFSSSWLYRCFIGRHQYDLLIAYMHGIPVKVISGNRRAKKMAWIHNGNPESSTMFNSWLLKKNAFRSYDSCDEIICVCQSVSEAFSQYTGIAEQVRVLYNTLDTESILSLAKRPVPINMDTRAIKLVSIGRLGKEKGYSRLLDVCKRLKEERCLFKLYLIGAGNEEAALKEKTKRLSLENEVIFLGYQENPYQYIDKCDIFVCSSFTEGLSTATIEALILGKAIVSTDVSGAKEILGNNEYGLVTENSANGIYEGLKQYFDNKDLIAEYGMKAKGRASVFSTESTVRAAEKEFDRLLQS